MSALIDKWTELGLLPRGLRAAPYGEYPRGGWQPCAIDEPCQNCGHPLGGHSQNSRAGSLTWNCGTCCGQCECQHWRCVHGGHWQAVSDGGAA